MMSVIDNAKDIASLIKKIGDIELYRKIIDLEGEIVEIAGRNHELQKEIEELREKLSFQGKMVFRKPFYYSEGDESPFCPRCWESERKAIHLLGPFEDLAEQLYECPQCKISHRL